MSLSLSVRRSRLLVVRDAILLTGSGALWLIDGPMENSPESAVSGNVLAVIDLTAAEFTLHETNATMAIDVIGNASNSGQPTWCRFVDGSATAVLDATAGPAGSGAQAIVADVENPSSAQLWTGGELSVSLTLSEN